MLSSHIQIEVIATDRTEGQMFVGFASASVLFSLLEHGDSQLPLRQSETHFGAIVFGLAGEPGRDWFIQRTGEQVVLHIRSDRNCAILLDDTASFFPYTDEPIPFVAYSEPWPDDALTIAPGRSLQSESNVLDGLSDHAPHLLLARSLAEDSTSPWCGRVRMEADATHGLHRRVSLGMMATAIRRFLDAAGTSAPVTQEQRFKLLLIFWQAVAHTFPHEWEQSRKHVLNKGIGLYALSRLLVDLVHEKPFHRITEKSILEWLSPFRRNVDWSNRGSLGRARSVDEAHTFLRGIIESYGDGRTVLENADSVDKRLITQERCDAERTAAERNMLGQFATSPDLAHDVVRHSLSLLGDRERVRFLDPAFGTGAFYDALLELSQKRIISALGFEVDPVYGKPAQNLWRDMKIKIRIEDFTRAALPRKGRFNLIVCNPPYVRYHHLPTKEKTRLQDVARRASGMQIGGQAGLHCYFLGIAHAWLEDGGLAAWLLPTQFMDANFGEPIRRYLLEKVTLIRVHRFAHTDGQFSDAVVTSTVIWFRKEPPTDGALVEFTSGGTIQSPQKKRIVPTAELRASAKWSRWPVGRVKSIGSTIGDYFTVKRGLSTGFDKFFILPRPKIERLKLPWQFFKPILPSPRFLDHDEVQADAEGNPKLEPQLFLLDCSLPESEIRRNHHTLWRYLAPGKDEVLTRPRCKNRSLWYKQETRPPSAFLSTYMGRKSRGKVPFRFILNHSKATATNSYHILYPGSALERALKADPDLKVQVWEALKAITSDELVGQGRTYGGGLQKLEPSELAKVPLSLDVKLDKS